MPLDTPYVFIRDMVRGGYIFRIVNKDTGFSLHAEKTRDPIPSTRFKRLWDEIIKPYASPERR